MNIPGELLTLAESNALEPAQFVAWCRETGLNANEASDSLASQIGRDYVEGRRDFVFCDRVMNSIMNAVTSEEFFAVSDREIPRLTMAVYLAFDAGEYVHSEDRQGEIQELKYTISMLKAALYATPDA